MYYLMLGASALLLAFDFALNKLYQKKMGTSVRAGLAFNALLGLISALIFFVASGFTLHVTRYSLLMAAGMTVLTMLYSLIGFRIMKKGSMALYTLFLMMGGMTVPYVWGLAFLEEQFSVLRMLGLVLIAFAVLLSNISREKIAVKPLLMCCAVFLLNGFVSVLSKTHQIETELAKVDTITFVMLSGVCKFVLAGIAYLIVCLREKASSEERSEGIKEKAARGASVLPIICGSAILGGGAFFLQLVSAAKLPGTVVFPIQTGGAVIFSSLAGVVFFREKLSRNTVIGLVACFVGTLLFL